MRRSSGRGRLRLPAVDSDYAGRLFPRMKIKPALPATKVAVIRGKSRARRRHFSFAQSGARNGEGLASAKAGERFLAKWQGRFTLPVDIDRDPRAAAILAKHVR